VLIDQISFLSTQNLKNIHVFSENIFKRYDIRGSYGSDLSILDAYFLGLTFASILFKKGQVIVGRDTRLSSPMLCSYLIKGLLDGGVDVFFIGIASSPLVAYADQKLAANAAITVTGSHNPKEQNGFKLLLNNAPFFAQQLLGLKNKAEKGIRKAEKKGKLIRKSREIKNSYKAYITGLFTSISEEKKVVWDASNGAMGPILRQIVQLLPGNHILLNTACDGNFPNHHPDPRDHANFKQIGQVMQAYNADIGFVFDGDGDRLGIIDAKGRIFSADQIAMIIAEKALQVIGGDKNKKVIVDVKISPWLVNYLQKLGAEVIFCKTGHSEIKTQMLKNKAIFACEGSQHFYFGKKYGCIDDAMIAAAFFLQAIEDGEIEDKLKQMPCTFSTGELRCNMNIKEMERIYARVYAKGIKGKIIKIDGIRVEAENGWWLCRPSNTEDCVTLLVEGYNEKEFLALLCDLQQIFPPISCKIMNNMLTGVIKQHMIYYRE
jgi:phosphomannomutase